MRTVRTPLIGMVAQAALLGIVAVSVGLGARGWAVGLLAGVAVNHWLARALSAAGATAEVAPTPGAANLITLARATLAGAVAALVADASARTLPVTATLTLTSIALSLDAVDGWVARRTGTASAVGAKFDGEVDAFLILVLSVAVARTAGWWVLAIGLWRYAFGLAGWVLPWLRPALPPRYWRKVVAAVQGIVLAAGVSGVLPRAVLLPALVLALLMLTESFTHDIWWLWDQHPRRSAEPTRARRIAGRVAMCAAVLVLWAALVAPDRPLDLGVTTFLRIPIEGVVLVAVAMVLPGRGRRFVALLSGAALAVLVFARILDLGFFSVLDRPFNPVTDWGSLTPAIGVLEDSIGRTPAILLTIGVVALVAAAVLAVTMATVQVTRLAVRHRHGATQTLIALGVAWTLCATLGVTTGTGAPVASRSTARAAIDEVHLVRTGLREQHTFDNQIAALDPFALTPGSRLLTGLRGKDVLLVFIESYGQTAVQGSSFSPQVDAVLRSGTANLRTAGFATRSAFLRSPTFGGGSWLAHSTLQSGLWVDNVARYGRLTAASRFTLSLAFKRAGWRTVFDLPATAGAWPEGERLYHFDQMYDATNVGYTGPRFSFARIPDQYTLNVLSQRELRSAQRSPLFAEVVLDSSHSPWTPLPQMVPWQDLGNGAIFGPMIDNAASALTVLHSSKRARAAYAQSIEYSLTALISFLQRSDDKNLVVIALGDHQPAPIVSGYTATHNVPVTIFARDQGVIDRIASWGWQDGMLPGADAPVWRMDAFRNRFLTTFGPRSAPALHAGGSGQ